MSKCFRESKSSGGRVKVELDLSNYATKSDLKNATGVNISNFSKNVDLATLKLNVDKLDIDKLEKLPIDLSSLKGKANELDIDKIKATPLHLKTDSRVREPNSF